METTIMNNMCRCCASEGAFKDIKTTYRWMGEDEVYGDMLKDCFDITLSASDSESGICEVCITQLRNAANFKKQVLHTEEQFLKHGQNKLFKPNIVKVELPVEDVLDGDDNNLSGDDAFSGAEYELPIKTEKVEEPKTKKRAAAKASTSRSKKQKTSDGEDTPAKNDPRETPMCLENSKTFGKTVLSILFTSKKRIERLESEESATETMKNRANLQNLLLYTNTNPIRFKDSRGYGCSFCPKYFSESAELKKHFLIEHNSDDLIKSVTKKYIEHVVKLDITHLNCALCDMDVPKMEDMVAHLKTVHNKEVYSDAKNQLLPFRFDTEQFQCAVCYVSFLTFKLLQEHMNVHYQNYVCKLCGAAFVMKRLYMSHVKRHGDGEYKCNICNKIFYTLQNKLMHVRSVHKGLDKRNKCKYCDERFRDYWKKIEHMIEKHGMPPVVLKCQACERTFKNQRLLRNHTKKYHLLERPHKCPECDMEFFGKSALEKHMPKHTGIKKYKCMVCLKSYVTKSTLTLHMRIHKDDRRYACSVCGQAFIQKCSWRGHMRSKHDKIV
ncbi:zinc finger protein 729 isoform X3 [Manduca sexta]|uniref:zinc finger protein 729 isoform X3 n=1 Tax=Manduca sexta TaxID=7130 RepID=UPI00188E483B|nr:zinc finger protein 729 isoform X3 [Manduca sexta]